MNTVPNDIFHSKKNPVIQKYSLNKYLLILHHVLDIVGAAVERNMSKILPFRKVQTKNLLVYSLIKNTAHEISG